MTRFVPACKEARMKRLAWLDITKGLAILWIVYFHLFNTYLPDAPSPIGDDFLSEVAVPDGWSSLTAGVETLGRLVVYGLTGLGFHGVGLFLVVSGWSLVQSTMKRAAKAPVSWSEWYRRRIFRLYPMYWVAHGLYVLFCVASNLTGKNLLIDQLEPLDSRFWLSFFGLRFINIESNFFYINAAWWYFTLLIQLYLLFPLLFICLRRCGTVALLVGSCLLGFGLRYFILVISPQHEALWGFSNGMWAQGGLGLCRLPEFAAGMVLGLWHMQNSERVERFLLRGRGVLLAIVAYPFAMMLYRNVYGYVFVDFATGLCFFLLLVGIGALIEHIPLIAGVLATAGAFSYGIYLLHQPHVIFLGLRIRELPPLAFAGAAVAGIAITSVWGILVEKTVNALLERIAAKKAAATA